MARITIDDLPRNEELDRDAVRSISGGGRAERPSSRGESRSRLKAPDGRIVDYPPGFGGSTAGTAQVKAGS